MNIKTILESGANITVSLNIEDLREWHKEVIQDTKREIEQTILADKAETYPGPRQVSEILNVDVSTLWRWKKRGYLVPVEIGGKRRYKMSEVKALLNGERRTKG